MFTDKKIENTRNLIDEAISNMTKKHNNVLQKVFIEGCRNKGYEVDENNILEFGKKHEITKIYNPERKYFDNEELHYYVDNKLVLIEFTKIKQSNSIADLRAEIEIKYINKF